VIKLVIGRFPLPPSDNRLYRNVMGIGRVKTKEYKAYAKAVEEWAYFNARSLSPIRRLAADAKLVYLEVLFLIHHPRLFTQALRPKRLDTTNRLKALCDMLAKILEVDDSKFWTVWCSKLPVEGVEDEGVAIRLSEAQSDGRAGFPNSA